MDARSAADHKNASCGESGEGSEHNLEAPPAISLRGLQLHAITEQQCIGYILESLDRGRGGWVVTPNLDILRRWEREADFRSLIEGADLIVADGMPLVWASRLARKPLPERVAGSSLISSLTAAAAAADRSIFLLGGAPGTAEGAATVLTDRNPSLRVAGTYCPPFGFEHEENGFAEILKRLAAAEPNIIYVALGSPKQDMVIRRLRAQLPEAWWLGIGISFSFLTGHVRRAPKWMQRAGLEWVHRLAQQPRALGRRYLIDGLPYALRLLGCSALEGVTGRTRKARRDNAKVKSHYCSM